MKSDLHGLCVILQDFFPPCRYYLQLCTEETKYIDKLGHQNQQTWELTTTHKMLHEHNNKDGITYVNADLPCE